MRIILIALSPLIAILVFCGLVRVTHRKSDEMEFNEEDIYK